MMLSKVTQVLATIVREAFWIAVAIAIVVGGVLGYRYLGENRDIVEANPVERPVALVETQALIRHDGPLPIRGEGFVLPFRQVAVSARTSGLVTLVHPAIINRGSFQEGEVLVQIDDRAQRTALDQTNANIVASTARLAQLRDDLERAVGLFQRQVATQTQIDQLETQIAEQEANLEGLRAAKAAAEIAIEDKQILAPFDGAILSKSVEVGDVVNAGQVLANAFTPEELEIDIAIRQTDAALIPGLFQGAKPQARIDIPFADYVFRWSGRVDRVEPQLDPATRTLTAAVRLNTLESIDGNGSDSTALASGAPPALINAFAEVVIEGIEPANVYRVPSVAVRGGDRLWLSRDGALTIHPARRVHVDGEWSFVELTDLPDGADVVLSALAAPVPGMPLRNLDDIDQAALQTGDRQ